MTAESHMTVSCLQLNSQGIIEDNIAQMQPMFEQAVHAGATLIAMPECAFQMEIPGRPREFYTAAEHPGVQTVRSWAKQYGVWVLIGSVGIVPESSHSKKHGAEQAKPYNRSLLINHEGSIAAHYDKIHLFDAELGSGERYRESNKYQAGGLPVIADSPLGKLGMTVCYDVRFPHLFRFLAQQGAGVIAVPAAFAETTGRDHWHVLLRARAIETGSFILAPAQCGEHPGSRFTYGHTMIISPWGRVLAELGDEPGALTFTLDLSEIEATRKKLPSVHHPSQFAVTNYSI